MKDNFLERVVSLTVFLFCITVGNSQIVISSDTTWSTNAVLNQSVLIDSNATLRILSGVQLDIAFLDQNNDSVGEIKIEVQGRLVLAGIPCDEIVFRPQGGNPQYGANHWKGIHFNSSLQNDSLMFFSLEYADSGIWANGSLDIDEAKIMHCNAAVIGFASANITINNCLINDIGGTGIQNYGGQLTADNCGVYSCGKFGVSGHGGFINISHFLIDNNAWGGVYVGSGSIVLFEAAMTNNGGAGVEISEWLFNNDFDTAGTKSTNPSINITQCNLNGNGSTHTFLNDSIIRKIVDFPEPWGNCSSGNPPIGLNQCVTSQTFELPFGSLDTVKPEVSHYWKHTTGTHHPMLYYLENGYKSSTIDSFYTTASGANCLVGATTNHVLEEGLFVGSDYTDKYQWKVCGQTNDTLQSPTLLGGNYQVRLGGFEVNSTVNTYGPMNFFANYWGVPQGVWIAYNEVDTANIDTMLPTAQSPLAGYFPKSYFPIANLGPDTTICSTNKLTLDAGTSGTSYLWSTGDTTMSIDSVDVAGKYYVSISNACGTSTDTLEIFVNQIPTVNAVGDSLICQGESSNLMASGASTYDWDHGSSTTASYLVFPPSTTLFTVYGTDTNGCTDSASWTVIVSPVDTAVTLSGDSLIASSSGQLQWLNCDSAYAAIPGETGSSIFIAISGNYALSVTENGCTDTSNCHNVNLVNRNDDFAGMNVYPNPNRGRLHLSFPGNPQGVSLNLSDMLGRKVLEEKRITQRESILDLHKLQAGTYILMIHNGTSVIHHKILLQN